MSYTSNFTGEEIDTLLSSIGGINATKKVLFEGELTTKFQTATLNDSVSNYDFLLVEAFCISDTAEKCVVETVVIDTSTIGYATLESGEYSYNIYSSSGVSHYYRILFNFNDETTIGLLSTSLESTVWQSPRISRVTGIKFSQATSTGSASNPIGSILPVMGMEAPQDYLICDGRELNINEYKELANYFEKQFGSKNHFGGDGSITFAIPDLRNEFLRGYGGGADTQLSGEIGVHQDATHHASIRTDADRHFVVHQANTNNYSNADTDIRLEGIIYDRFAWSENWTDVGYYTSRPTNVAVLFCIKYTENTSERAGENNYSTEEQKIGTWIDGKPIYRKVYTGRTVPVVSADGQNNLDTLHVDDLNIDTVIHLHGRVYNSGAIFNSPYDYSNTVHGLAHYYRVQYKEICTSNYSKEYGGRNMDIIIEYTKTTD